MSFIANNIYILYSVAARANVLDLESAGTADGTPCQGWPDELNTIYTFGQQWLISDVHGQPDVYTLRNLRSGTYLDLNGGLSENGTQVQGYSKAPVEYEHNQQWRIILEGQDYRLQNVAGGTYLDLSGGLADPGTKVQGWEYHMNAPGQKWRLHCVSRTQHEIEAIVRSNPHIGIDFKSYNADGLYITLRENVRNEIYNGTGLSTTEWRRQIFDCDDFAFVAKAEVAKWGNGFFYADGFAILWGVMFGANAVGAAHAYNWYLNDDLDTIMFFEPQNGQQMTDIGYQAYFGVF